MRVGEYRYKAFISYSHADERWATWLHGQLEGYEPPEALEIRERLEPIFRDRDELAASRDLNNTIKEALAVSESLIVVCSPNAVRSQWVNAEIEYFMALGRDENIYCLIVDGTPNDPQAECLPELLRTREPLAADARPESDGRSNAVLRLASSLLGVSFNDLRRRERSIAVLPFRDLSPAGDMEYLSDGIAEELSHALTQLRNLRVISRGSSFEFRDSSLATSEIGRRLDATYVVEGSIRLMKDTTRVAVQLTDARTDTTGWSKTYERKLAELFSLQDELAADVAAELHRKVAKRTHQDRPVNPQAHQLVLRAKHLASQFNREALERSNELLRQALALAPDYVDAWNVLSGNYAAQAGEGFVPTDEGIGESRAAIEKALAIDPENPGALAELGWLALRYDNDLTAAARYLEQALPRGLNDVPVLNASGGLLMRLRRLDEAIEVARRVIELDPLSSHAAANLGVYSLIAGHADEAIQAYLTALELSPSFVGGHYAIGLAWLQKHQYERAQESMRRETDEEFRTKGEALVCHSQGRTEEFQARLDRLIEQWGHLWPSEVAEVYAHAGDADAAFEWIARDIEASEGMGWAETVQHQVFASLVDDPRWPMFLEQINLAPAQLAAIEFRVPESLFVD